MHELFNVDTLFHFLSIINIYVFFLQMKTTHIHILQYAGHQFQILKKETI